MHTNSGLSDTACKDDVMKATLDYFVNRFNEVELIDDNISIEDWAKSYMKDNKSHSTFCFYDCTGVLNQYKTWFNIFGNIQPFYGKYYYSHITLAMKCNPSRGMMLAMSTFPGICVDCASPEEIRICLENNIDSSRIIYANPIKSVDAIEYMRDMNVWCTTLDCVEEVEKMKNVLGDDVKKCKIVLRLHVDDSHASCPLGSKFGCYLNEVPAILTALNKYEMTAVGISFHVGSGNCDPCAYDDALCNTGKCFELAKEYGYEMNLVDLGGGWPGMMGTANYGNEFLESASKVINEALIKYGFDKVKDLKLITEPGRYFNDQSLYLSCIVDSVCKRGDRYVYRINEGIMGVFKEGVLGHLSFDTTAFLYNQLSSDEVYPSVILGSSSLKKDIIVHDIDLPQLSVGDRLFFSHGGAYTVSESNQTFRANHKVVYCVRRSSVVR